MSHHTTAELIINTTNGRIQGRENTSVYDDIYYSFEKIPYACPPLGELRFHAPVPVGNWTQVLDCTQKLEKPLQRNLLTNAIEGAEDCLYLNIFVKKLKSSKPLPVMVFLFGGGFERGDPTRDLHGPDYFMMKDVVLVSIGYRVGPLGFLSLADPAAKTPGNAGLKDQLLALRWINDNIAHFNGDPNNITLFGESAGAASAHYMMLSPLAKGLFHKTILISGNVLCPWALSPLTDLPQRLAQSCGFKGDITNDKAVLEYLKALDASELVRPSLLTRPEYLDDCHFAFGPVVEPYPNENCIVPRQPVQLLDGAWGNAIPTILGGTSFEGLLMYARAHVAPFIITDLKDNPEHMLPLELKRKYDLEKQKTLASQIQKTHFADKELNLAAVLNYCEYASYKVFWHPILRTLKARLSSTHAPTFLYRFDFDSPVFNHQRIKYCGKELRGVAHVDDHSYIFYGNFSWKLSQQSAEYKTIERMIDIWTTFAASSNPNCKQIEGVQWMSLSDKNKNTHNNNNNNSSNGDNTLQCLNIDAEVRVIDLPEMEKLQIWQSLYETN